MSLATQILIAFAVGFFAVTIARNYHPEPPRAMAEHVAVALDCPGQHVVRSVIGDFCR